MPSFHRRVPAMLAVWALLGADAAAFAQALPNPYRAVRG
jgi:hypothetical protein